MEGTKFSFPTPSTTVTLDADLNMKLSSFQGELCNLFKFSVPVDIVTKEVLIEQQTTNISKHLLIPRTLTRINQRLCSHPSDEYQPPADYFIYRTRIEQCVPVHSLMCVDTDSSVTQANNVPKPDVDIDLYSQPNSNSTVATVVA